MNETQSATGRYRRIVIVDEQHERPKEQWWLDLRPIAHALAHPAPRPSRRKHAERGNA
jgi:hypothetical protein